jgi:hypothetical protein
LNTPCLGVALGDLLDLLDLLVIVGDPLIEMAQLLGQPAELGAKAFAQPIVSVLQDLRQAPLERRTALRDLNAVFQQQAADLVDLRRAPLHRQAAHAVDGLDVLLLDRLDRHEAHVRALGGLADGLGIGRIVLAWT